MAAKRQQPLIVAGTILIAAGTIIAILPAYITLKAIQHQVRQALENPPPYKVKGKLASIVIPSLEEESYLPNLFQTIKNQTYEPIEVIVADSSSSLSKEKIEAICEEFSATYIHVLKLGLSLARNEGAKAAKGDFLIFTDADCLMSHSYVEKITSALNKGYILAHGADPSVDGVVHTLPTILSRKWFKPRTYTTGRGIGISRDAFFKIGGYNEDLDPMLGYREDLDLGKRIKENYGSSSIVLLKDAVIATSPRREQTFGFHMWKSRGVRGNRILPY